MSTETVNQKLSDTVGLTRSHFSFFLLRTTEVTLRSSSIAEVYVKYCSSEKELLAFYQPVGACCCRSLIMTRSQRRKIRILNV